jgi:Cu-Zn family superoxide dismutase
VYNPTSRRHADRGDYPERPLGALGNIHADASGVAAFDFVDEGVRLIGPLSVVGRCIGITAGVDDCGRGSNAASGVDGNAGPLVAAGIIGIAAPGTAPLGVGP